jgi:hypothetical protein
MCSTVYTTETSREEKSEMTARQIEWRKKRPNENVLKQKSKKLIYIKMNFRIYYVY